MNIHIKHDKNNYNSFISVIKIFWFFELLDSENQISELQIKDFKSLIVQ